MEKHLFNYERELTLSSNFIRLDIIDKDGTKLIHGSLVLGSETPI